MISYICYAYLSGLLPTCAALLCRALQDCARKWIRDGQRWCGSAQICHMLMFENRYLCEAVQTSATWILGHLHKCGVIHNGFTGLYKVMEL